VEFITMSICLIGSYEDVVAANQKIELNSGIPNEDTACWDVPKEAYNQNFWFIEKPLVTGWNDLTQEQMMQDVVNVTEVEFDSSWLQPATP
jgi:hypothetical protein